MKHLIILIRGAWIGLLGLLLVCVVSALVLGPIVAALILHNLGWLCGYAPILLLLFYELGSEK